MCPEDHLAEQLRLQQRKIRERIAKQQIEERERTQNGKDQKRIAKKREKAYAESLRIDKEKKDLAEKNLVKQQYREIAIDLSEEDALLEEILTAERMEVLNTQPCPNCHVKIEKNGGCLHMHCSRCGYSFIWSALERRQPLQMTSLLYHSSDVMPIQSIKTELYKKSDTEKVSEQSKEDEIEQDSTVLINNRSFIGSAIVKRVKQCPNISCNKLNVKMGEDNWIKREKMGIDINKIFDKGPFSIGEVSYEYPIVNDTEITPFSTNLTTQIRGQLYFPNNTQGSLPILIFLPGKHADCRLLALPGYPGLDAGATDIFGHCQDNLARVASHLGYAYLSEYFASHGYIVISIDVALINNRWPIPGDLTLNFVRARIVLRTLQKMIELNNNAEMSKQILNGIDLSGKFDFTQVGLMGHSRGGEGVRNAYNMLMENKGPSDTLKWRERLPDVMIKAIMEIVPMYYGENGTKFGVGNVPWAMMVSGCEDDEIDYAHVYLAYRQLQSAKRPNHVIHVYGANHEYFNTEWQVGIPACFGDQDPLWDVNAPTFKVSDIFPPAAGTPLDYTLLKINGSESQRKTAIFALAAFFRAYVGVNADPEFAKLLNPSTSLPDNMTELGRQYFDNTQSIQLFNGTGNITGSSGVEIMPLRMYAESMFPSFATSYDNSPISPPQFFSDPPKKGNLSLGCLEQIENGVHINFDNNKQSEVIISFNKVEIKKISAIDIQLARRSSCWFTSTHSSTCEEPREMKLNIQLQTNTGFSSNTTIFLKSRYNLQFTRCEAMSFPPEKIGYLPVMFETIRILVTNDQYISGLKLSSQNGGSLVLDNIAAIIQQSSNASFLSKSIYLLFSLFFISVIFHAYYFLQI
ncbi:unnamed protein product [Adineta steineri]|uniref:RING-type domain-containing protein n=1 Tax=Adineta steineri TaxID=433720 RepID=A0A819T6K3_9BILA|nr:unnamed protein product [Adineta steineri]